MLTRLMLFMAGFMMASGLALAQNDDMMPPPAGPDVPEDTTPPTESAKPELEGYESRESIEVRNGETPPPTAPSVTDDTPPTGDATPELEGYDSKESTDIDS